MILASSLLASSCWQAGKLATSQSQVARSVASSQATRSRVEESFDRQRYLARIFFFFVALRWLDTGWIEVYTAVSRKKKIDWRSASSIGLTEICLFSSSKVWIGNKLWNLERKFGVPSFLNLDLEFPVKISIIAFDRNCYKKTFLFLCIFLFFNSIPIKSKTFSRKCL